MARALVRVAFLTVAAPDDDGVAHFNPDLMKQAQHELEAMRREKLPGVSPQAVRGLLILVRLRTEPQGGP